MYIYGVVGHLNAQDVSAPIQITYTISSKVFAFTLRSRSITHYTAIYQYTLIVLIHHYKSKLNSQQKVFKTFCLPISFLLDPIYHPGKLTRFTVCYKLAT